MKGIFQSGRFWCHADHVEHRNTAGGSRRCAEGFERIFLRRDLHPEDDRNLVERALANQVPKHRIKVIAALQFLRDIRKPEEDLSAAVLRQVQADRWDSTGDRTANVEE